MTHDLTGTLSIETFEKMVLQVGDPEKIVIFLTANTIIFCDMTTNNSIILKFVKKQRIINDMEIWLAIHKWKIMKS